MPYRIRFKGSETTALRAHTPYDALVIAQGLVEEGRGGISVTLGDGEPIPLREFAALVRDGSPLAG